MNDSEKNDQAFAIGEAIRAKRGGKPSLPEEIAALECSLLADIETFDLDAAVRLAQREELVNSATGVNESALAFPEITPVTVPRKTSVRAIVEKSDEPELMLNGSSLLSQLRQQAELRRQELHSGLAERSSLNEQIDQALKHVFFFLHDFAQQLNILKPVIPRHFPLLEQYAINHLTWQEGFADYRTQSHSAGALVELVTLTCRLSGHGVPVIEKEGPAIERFRHILFDYGLPFTCKEFKNERGYVERAEFEIRGEVSVGARWRADFDQGVLVLETRNLERLGSAVFTIRPQFVDDALLDDFGRLILGQDNRFRELAKRQ